MQDNEVESVVGYILQPEQNFNSLIVFSRPVKQADVNRRILSTETILAHGFAALILNHGGRQKILLTWIGNLRTINFDLFDNQAARGFQARLFF